ncbi:unnamed protein product [Amoebophrya sp. A120]|nr:unnamed protein product [Amoebophrya sp. A120]|eukprot:GSA120T00024184001.1
MSVTAIFTSCLGPDPDDEQPDAVQLADEDPFEVVDTSGEKVQYPAPPRKYYTKSRLARVFWCLSWWALRVLVCFFHGTVVVFVFLQNQEHDQRVEQAESTREVELRRRSWRVLNPPPGREENNKPRKRNKNSQQLARAATTPTIYDYLPSNVQLPDESFPFDEALAHKNYSLRRSDPVSSRDKILRPIVTVQEPLLGFDDALVKALVSTKYVNEQADCDAGEAAGPPKETNRLEQLQAFVLRHSLALQEILPRVVEGKEDQAAETKLPTVLPAVVPGATTVVPAITPLSAPDKRRLQLGPLSLLDGEPLWVKAAREAAAGQKRAARAAEDTRQAELARLRKALSVQRGSSGKIRLRLVSKKEFDGADQAKVSGLSEEDAINRSAKTSATHRHGEVEDPSRTSAVLMSPASVTTVVEEHHIWLRSDTALSGYGQILEYYHFLIDFLPQMLYQTRGLCEEVKSRTTWVGASSASSSSSSSSLPPSTIQSPTPCIIYLHVPCATFRWGVYRPLTYHLAGWREKNYYDLKSHWEAALGAGRKNLVLVYEPRHGALFGTHLAGSFLSRGERTIRMGQIREFVNFVERNVEDNKEHGYDGATSVVTGSASPSRSSGTLSRIDAGKVESSWNSNYSNHPNIVSWLESEFVTRNDSKRIVREYGSQNRSLTLKRNSEHEFEDEQQRVAHFILDADVTTPVVRTASEANKARPKRGAEDNAERPGGSGSESRTPEAGASIQPTTTTRAAPVQLKNRSSSLGEDQNKSHVRLKTTLRVMEGFDLVGRKEEISQLPQRVYKYAREYLWRLAGVWPEEDENGAPRDHIRPVSSAYEDNIKEGTQVQATNSPASTTSADDAGGQREDPEEHNNNVAGREQLHKTRNRASINHNILIMLRKQTQRRKNLSAKWETEAKRLEALLAQFAATRSTADRTRSSSTTAATSPSFTVRMLDPAVDLGPKNSAALEEETPVLVDSIRVFYNATVLIGTHGAALSNALFMKSGSLLVEVGPRNEGFATPFENLANRTGIDYIWTGKEIENCTERIVFPGIKKFFGLM